MSHPEESKEQLSVHTDKPSTSNSSLASTSALPAASSSLPPSDVQLRPSYSLMFKPRQVETLMRQYVEEYLHDKQYDANESGNWAKDMAAHIKNKLKGQSAAQQNDGHDATATHNRSGTRKRTHAAAVDNSLSSLYGVRCLLAAVRAEAATLQVPGAGHHRREQGCRGEVRRSMLLGSDNRQTRADSLRQRQTRYTIHSSRASQQTTSGPHRSPHCSRSLASRIDRTQCSAWSLPSACICIDDTCYAIA